MSASRVNFTGMAAVRNALYNAFMRRSSVYVLTLVGAGYAATKGMDACTDALWERANHDKLWRNVQPRIQAAIEAAEAEEDGGD